MAHKIYVGIDNGTSGTIGWVGEGVSPHIIETPKFAEQSYTKEKKIITRIDHIALRKVLSDIMGLYNKPSDIIAVMERPLINPKYFSTSISAARSLEATLCVIEDMKIPHLYVDSRQWQPVMLPKGVKGSNELKRASRDIGLRLFPDQADVIKKHKDADALLIASWAEHVKL